MRVVFFNKIICFYADIIFRCNIKGNTRTGKANRCGAACIAGNYFQRIGEIDGIKNRFKVVKTITSFTRDTKAEIYFAVGEADHANYS